MSCSDTPADNDAPAKMENIVPVLKKGGEDPGEYAKPKNEMRRKTYASVSANPLIAYLGQ